MNALSRALGVVSLAFASLAACGPYALRPGELPPARANIALDARNATWQRGVVALLDHGYVPTILNEQAGYINARRRDDLTNDSLAGTTVFVVVGSDGVVRVSIAGVGNFSSEQEFLRVMSERQTQLLNEIVGTPSPPPSPPAAASAPRAP